MGQSIAFRQGKRKQWPTEKDWLAVSAARTSLMPDRSLRKRIPVKVETHPRPRADVFGVPALAGPCCAEHAKAWTTNGQYAQAWIPDVWCPPFRLSARADFL